MNITTLIILLLLPPLSWILCRVVLNYARKREIFDIPNARSSHNVAKPRGGGLAVVITFLLFILVMFIMKAIPKGLFLALFGGGALIAFIGWMDDKKGGISLKIRLLVQLAAAIWSIYWLQGLPQIRIGEIRMDFGIFGALLGIIGVIWVTNLYNFMDGIDGIAASEAVTVGIFAGCLSILAGANSLAALSFALALSSLGFLVWNWAPAKIFMGDVGSGFLGFIFALLAIASENSGGPPLVIWVLLLGVFLVDATATLIRRICLRECWYEAHRSHSYQYATQIGFSHKQVTLAVIYLNCMLAGSAFIIWKFSFVAIPILLLVFSCLLFIQVNIYIKYKSYHRNAERRFTGKEIQTIENKQIGM